jgi:hypothetical protein
MRVQRKFQAVLSSFREPFDLVKSEPGMGTEFICPLETRRG